MSGLGNRSGAAGSWELWVDTGGTFTDCLARPPDGPLRRVKVLSSSSLRIGIEERLDERRLRVSAPRGLESGSLDGWKMRDLDGEELAAPESFDSREEVLSLRSETDAPSPGAIVELDSPEEAPVLAARLATGTPPDGDLPPLVLRLATTLGTNALLERRGARCALFTTRGFGDLLVIGTQQRPDLFALAPQRPPPLYEVVVEVDERLAADGSVVEPIRLDEIGSRIDELVEDGVRAGAIALMNAHRDRCHEERLASELRVRGFTHLSRSADLAAEQGYLTRAETAVVDAYVAPVLADYLDRVRRELEESRVLVMTSAGGLIGAEQCAAKDVLLSGPAGGVVGASASGDRSGREKLISFDMGGTSTDVARCDPEPSYVFEHRVGDAHLLAPAVGVETVAAGGGSVCGFDGQRLTVGPESGGARPGPACYGAGGPLCLTDVNLLCGRLHPERFHIPLDTGAAREAFDDLLAGLSEAGRETGESGVLDGLRRIADERMADAIRRISVREGYDPAEHALVAFGGAGPQHACAIAELLGVATVLVPAEAGVLSAVGLGAAAIERFASRELLAPIDEVAGRIDPLFDELVEQARREIEAEGVAAERTEVERRLAFLRVVGQESTVELSYRKGHGLEDLFARRYQELYGYSPGNRRLEVVSLRVVVAERRELPEVSEPPTDASVPRPVDRIDGLFEDIWREVPCFERCELGTGVEIGGPALVLEDHTTTVVESAWHLTVDDSGILVLFRE